jgi:hypothetical protein
MAVLPTPVFCKEESVKTWRETFSWGGEWPGDLRPFLHTLGSHRTRHNHTGGAEWNPAVCLGQMGMDSWVPSGPCHRAARAFRMYFYPGHHHQTRHRLLTIGYIWQFFRKLLTLSCINKDLPPFMHINFISQNKYALKNTIWDKGVKTTYEMRFFHTLLKEKVIIIF